MEINNSALTTATSHLNSEPLRAEKNKVTQEYSGQASAQVELSAQGQLLSEMDAISLDIDTVLYSKLSDEQQTQVNALYQKIDITLSSDNPSASDQEKAENLFEQVHNILESSIKNLTPGEEYKVNKLINKLDEKEQQLSQLESMSAPGVSGTVQSSAGSAKGSNLESLMSSSGPSSRAKKKLTTAELNALSAVELNKLPVSQLSKLNAQQLNKLNASKLNQLPLAQLQKLSATNIAKLNSSQAEKLQKIS